MVHLYCTQPYTPWVYYSRYPCAALGGLTIPTDLLYGLLDLLYGLLDLRVYKQYLCIFRKAMHDLRRKSIGISRFGEAENPYIRPARIARARSARTEHEGGGRVVHKPWGGGGPATILHYVFQPMIKYRLRPYSSMQSYSGS